MGVKYNHKSNINKIWVIMFLDMLSVKPIFMAVCFTFDLLYNLLQIWHLSLLCIRKGGNVPEGHSFDPECLMHVGGTCFKTRWPRAGVTSCDALRCFLVHIDCSVTPVFLLPPFHWTMNTPPAVAARRSRHNFMRLPGLLSHHLRKQRSFIHEVLHTPY